MCLGCCGGSVWGTSSCCLQEREVLRLQQDIKQQVDQKMTNQKRTYFLQEQLKSIKKELGLEKDDKEAILNKFKDRRKKIKVGPVGCCWIERGVYGYLYHAWYTVQLRRRAEDKKSRLRSDHMSCLTERDV